MITTTKIADNRAGVGDGCGVGYGWNGSGSGDGNADALLAALESEGE